MIIANILNFGGGLSIWAYLGVLVLFMVLAYYFVMSLTNLYRTVNSKGWNETFNYNKRKFYPVIGWAFAIIVVFLLVFVSFGPGERVQVTAPEDDGMLDFIEQRLEEEALNPPEPGRLAVTPEVLEMQSDPNATQEVMEETTENIRKSIEDNPELYGQDAFEK